MRAKKINVLFVCLGNICRSPMAEAIFIHLVKTKGWQAHFFIDSAGTSDYHEGEHYHVETRHVVEKNKMATQGLSRPVQKKDFETFDYILAMDTSNHADLLQMCTEPALRSKVSHILKYSEQDFIPGLDVPDPFYGGRDGFERIFEILTDACQGLLQKIAKEHGLEKY